jgi:riboflavin kinase/FMN adenylyltransferase
MEFIRGLEALQKYYSNTILTIGNFDGVHLGHQKILFTVIKRAGELKGTSMAITFEPHPLAVLAPEREIKILTTLKEKTKLMEAMGINVLLCINFNKEFSELSPDDFIRDVLVGKIGAKEVTVGHGYAFGKNRRGTTELLRRRGRKFGFSVRVIRDAKVNGEVVSSSKVRSLLMKGRVYEASTLLGRAYSIEGDVISGMGRGGELLDTHTANITTPDEFVPKEGVYAVRVGLDNEFFDGVANIGRKPTFGNSDISYEVHLFNFSGDLRGEHIRIYFIDWVRSERLFSDVLSLKEQIMKDIRYAKEILIERNPKLI